MEDDEIELTWEGVAGYFETIEKLGISVNQALLVGQGSLRRTAIGLEDRRPSEDERRLMARKLIEALDDGAFGLSTGLGYVPGLFTPTDEIIFLARVVARRNGFYASHIRNEEGRPSRGRSTRPSRPDDNRVRGSKSPTSNPPDQATGRISARPSI